MTQNNSEATRNAPIEQTSAAVNITPLVDIYENENELLLVADLPHVTPESLSVEVKHPELKIAGRSREGNKQHEYVYTRTFHLDSSIDVGKIEARLKEGVLEVHLPKSEPFQVRKIAVQS